jgi:hypothetical protein
MQKSVEIGIIIGTEVGVIVGDEIGFIRKRSHTGIETVV